MCFEDGVFHFRSHQPTTEILQLNTAFLNADRASSSLWGGSGYVRVAQVPLAFIDYLITKKGINPYSGDPDMQTKFLQMLSSNEYEKFRTAPGRLA
jgi:hypothetical protein